MRLGMEGGRYGEVRTAAGMEIFRRALREMAAGRVEVLNFGDLPGVSALQGIRLFLTLVSEEPKVTLMKVIRGHDLKRGLGPEFTWRRSREGWWMCVELAEKLGAGKGQSFSEEGILWRLRWDMGSDVQKLYERSGVKA